MEIVGMGEALIDFTPEGKNPDGMELYSQNPGGAPANVLATVSKLGGSTGFIGKVGADQFGFYLRDTLHSLGVDVQGLCFSTTAATTITFVTLDEKGDRSFSFYRNPGADETVTLEDVKWQLLEHVPIFHFGSLTLTKEPSRTTTLEVAKKAKERGCIISYDPNYRNLLWESPQLAVDQMQKGAQLADIIKVSEEELELLTGESNPEVGAKILSQGGITLVLITLGAQGAYYNCNGTCGFVPGFSVDTVDTTGAGDSFLGAVLYQLRNTSLKELRSFSSQQLTNLVQFANATAALTTTKKGAMTAFFTKEEVDQLLHTRK